MQTPNFQAMTNRALLDFWQDVKAVQKSQELGQQERTVAADLTSKAYGEFRSRITYSPLRGVRV